MQRRDFLIDLTRNAALCAVVPNLWRVTWRPRFEQDPFQLGVACGDPTPHGAVIWTRLAPEPLAPDGGLYGRRIVVTWEVAEDDRFTKIVKKGQATAAPELAFSIHVDVDGLEPDRWYFYRFRSGDADSPIGRLRTTPAPGAQSRLRFAFASCQQWEDGFYTAYEHMAKEELDLVAHLGDYIYENGNGPNAVRKHATSEIRDLQAYRTRYAQYKTDPALQAVHLLCPWVVTWDDHEVDNNYAGLVGENGMESEEQIHQRRAAAYQAWWEHQPVRVSRAKSWADLTITRRIDWGALAQFHVLDGRQYRSPVACGGGSPIVPCGDWADPKRTMLGDAQEKWLADGLAKSSARWQVIANQVMVAPFDSEPGPRVRDAMDRWSGYPAARDRLLQMIAQRAPNRTVVITGDIHSSWVNELHSDFSRPDRPVVAAEFVGTSISSGGDGAEQPGNVRRGLPENPHIKWQNSRRGYVSCRVDASAWHVEYKTVAYISKPGAPLQTPTRWRVEHSRPGITAV